MRVVKKPEERKAEMVAAAAGLFAQHGFVRTSVAEIVAAVDVAKGLFYYYFTTKEDMVKAVMETYCDDLGRQVQEIAEGEGSAQEKAERILFMEAWSRYFTAPLIQDLCLPQYAGLYADVCDRLYDHMRPGLEQICAQALAERGEDTGRAAQIVGVTHYGLLMVARRSGMTMDDAREMIAKMTGFAPEVA